MSIEERFDRLLMDDVKYWKVVRHDVDCYNNDNKVSTYLSLIFNQDDKKQIFCINYRDIWSVLETEYSLDFQQIKEFTSSRLEQAYNFMDITTSQCLRRYQYVLEQAYNSMDTTTLSYNNLYKYKV